MSVECCTGHAYILKILMTVKNVEKKTGKDKRTVSTRLAAVPF